MNSGGLWIPLDEWERMSEEVRRYRARDQKLRAQLNDLLQTIDDVLAVEPVSRETEDGP